MLKSLCLLIQSPCLMVKSRSIGRPAQGALPAGRGTTFHEVAVVLGSRFGLRLRWSSKISPTLAIGGFHLFGPNS